MSECHKIAIDYETNLSRTCGNVWEMSSDAAKKTMEYNRICFIKVIEYLQYLARQRQAMQGDTDDGKGKVCARAKWPIRPELIPVSVA